MKYVTILREVNYSNHQIISQEYQTMSADTEDHLYAHDGLETPTEEDLVHANVPTDQSREMRDTEKKEKGSTKDDPLYLSAGLETPKF